MKKQEVQTILEAHEIRPLPSLSQNFLLNEKIRDEIVEVSLFNGVTHAVEIGGGIGVLTEELLNQYEYVTVFEIDKTLAQILRERFYTNSRLTILQQDALASLKHWQDLEVPYTVIANIPYHLTNRLVRFLLTEVETTQAITLLVQKEVAERLTSADEEYSLFRLSVELYADVEYIRDVSRVNFYPRPDVDSAVIRLIRHERFRETDTEAVLEIARLAFQQKRKKIRTSIKKQAGYSAEQIEQALENCDLSVDIRPQTLTPEEWVCFVEELKANMG